MFTIIIILVIVFLFAIIIGAAHNASTGNDVNRGEGRQALPDSLRSHDRYDYDKRQQKAFGKKGEEYVAEMLEEVAVKYNGYVFNNFTFKDEEGYSADIDHILVCVGGLFVIETKSNKGVIFGDKDEEEWCAQKNDWQSDKVFRNPIKQNNGHINHLRKMLGKTSPAMISMIIFPFAESISNVDNSFVYDLDSAREYIIDMIDEGNYSSQFVERVKIRLSDIQEKYGISLEEHEDILKRRYN